MKNARRRLGETLVGRLLSVSEMASLLRVSPETLRTWERRAGPTGPVALAIELMLAGARPDGWQDMLRRAERGSRRD